MPVYNMNGNGSLALKSQCRILKEYAWLTDEVRVCRKQLKEVSTESDQLAIDMALDRMPEQFEIRRLLLDHKREVTDMLLEEYDEEREWAMIKKDLKKAMEADVRKEVEEKVRKEMGEQLRKESEDKLRRETEEKLQQEAVARIKDKLKAEGRTEDEISSFIRSIYPEYQTAVEKKK